MGLGGAEGIGLGLDAGDCGDVLAVGGEDDGFEAGEVDGVAGMDDSAGGGADGFEVGGEVVAGDVRVFAVLAVVDEFADGDAGGDEIGNAADVIDVEMGDEDVIEAGDAGVVHGGLDAFGVTGIGSGPAGIDEEGCAGGGDDEGGLAALNIDGVDEERVFGLGGGGDGEDGCEGKGDGEAEEACFAGASHLRGVYTLEGRGGKGQPSGGLLYSGINRGVTWQDLIR